MTPDVSGDLAVDIVSEVVELDAGPSNEPKPPLGEVIDMDALGQLVAKSQRSVRVTFEYLGCEVIVTSGAADYEVCVRPN